MDNNVLVLTAILGYIIIGMLIADTLLATGARYFTLVLFWLPLIVLLIVSAIILAIIVEGYDLWSRFIHWLQFLKT
jgi:hypothetical protein